MENRRVVSSNKNRDYKNLTPSSGTGRMIFQRVKRLFSPSSWNEHPTEAERKDEEYTSNGDIAANSTRLKFHNQNQSGFHTPLRENRNMSEQTPSQLLSSFFQEKGDKPLTEIEYEGVLSLLDKSKDGRETSFSYGKAREAKENNQLVAPSANTSSTLPHSRFATPYVQKTLRRSMANRSFSTPEYKAVYKSLDNSFSNNPASVKRVYQFSGVPSPYRTRIRIPKPSSSSSRMQTKDIPKAEGASSLAIPDSTSNTPKQLSETAASILSILDGDDSRTEKAQQESAKVSRFEKLGNPYHRFSGMKHGNSDGGNDEPPTKKRTRPVLTAGDISKTALFSRAEEDSSDPSTNADESKEKLAAPSEVEIKQTNNYENIKPESVSKNRIEVPVHGDKTCQAESTANGQIGKERNIYFESKKDLSHGSRIGMVKSPIADRNSAVVKKYYDFPDIPTRKVSLNREKVASYREIFQF